MTFTIEPGLYIRQSVLDQLPKTPANLALIGRSSQRSPNTTTSASAIEDSFVVEDAGVRNLSAALPADHQDVETFMRRSRTPTGAR